MAHVGRYATGSNEERLTKRESNPKRQPTRQGQMVSLYGGGSGGGIAIRTFSKENEQNEWNTTRQQQKQQPASSQCAMAARHSTIRTKEDSIHKTTGDSWLEKSILFYEKFNSFIYLRSYANTANFVYKIPILGFTEQKLKVSIQCISLLCS